MRHGPHPARPRAGVKQGVTHTHSFRPTRTGATAPARRPGARHAWQRSARARSEASLPGAAAERADAAQRVRRARAPHSQGAQKSTSTGMGDFSTSASNDASVTAVAARAGACVRARDDDHSASVASQRLARVPLLAAAAQVCRRARRAAGRAGAAASGAARAGRWQRAGKAQGATPRERAIAATGGRGWAAARRRPGSHASCIARARQRAPMRT